MAVVEVEDTEQMELLAVQAVAVVVRVLVGTLAQLLLKEILAAVQVTVMLAVTEMETGLVAAVVELQQLEQMPATQAVLVVQDDCFQTLHLMV